MGSFYKIIKWCDNLNLQALPLYAKHTNRNREPLPQLFQPPFLHCNRKFFGSLLCNNKLFRRWAFFLSIQLLFPSVYNCPQIIFPLLNLNFQGSSFISTEEHISSKFLGFFFSDIFKKKFIKFCFFRLLIKLDLFFIWQIFVRFALFFPNCLYVLPNAEEFIFVDGFPWTKIMVSLEIFTAY